MNVSVVEVFLWEIMLLAILKVTTIISFCIAGNNLNMIVAFNKSKDSVVPQIPHQAMLLSEVCI